MNSSNQGANQEKAHLKLSISTWSKDSHGLYDYESTNQSYKVQHFKVQSTTVLYRDSFAPRTLLLAKNEKAKLTPRESFAPIANIVFEKKQGKTTPLVRFEPVLGKEPIDPATYDTTKTFYKVIRDKNPEIMAASQGYPLKPGYIVKMGRVEYMVIEMRNNKDTLTIRDTNHFNENNGVFEFKKDETIVEPAEPGSEVRCKVCLCTEETEEDPLISPCLCKGSMKKIHVGCLRQWINSKVKKQISDIATSYNFTKFECEICKRPFPKIIKFDGKEIEMMTITKPTKPYIILESLNRAGEMAKEERCLHLITAKENSQIRIGRGHQCEIRLIDISVSRSHAKIIFTNDQFYIKDEKSKFGTLIKFDGAHSFEHENILRVQYGRSLFEFQMVVPQEQDTEQEGESNQKNPNEEFK